MIAPGTPQVLMGIGKINGDGWKDTTRIGEIVFVWNEQLKPPYGEGQYPRVGNEGWSASCNQYEFHSATVSEVRDLFSTLTAQRDALVADLLEALDFIANVARTMPGFSPMALKQADTAIAKARGQS